MALEFKRIYSIEEVDFDNLFLESYEGGFDDNFAWPEQAIAFSYEQKKSIYKTQLQQAIEGIFAMKKEGEEFLMFKVILDGKDVMFKAGYIENDHISHRGHWYLTATDNTGSRKWLYTEEFDRLQREFHAQYGITQHKVLTYVGSPLYKMLYSRTNYLKRINAVGRATVEVEEPMGTRVPGREALDFVRLTVVL
jgi:hypothetical protein